MRRDFDADPHLERRRLRARVTFALVTILAFLALVAALGLRVSSFTLDSLDQPLVLAGCVILWIVLGSFFVLVVGLLVAPWRARTTSTSIERGEWGLRRWQTTCVRIIGSGFISVAVLLAIETVRQTGDGNLPDWVGTTVFILLGAGTLFGILALLWADRFTLTADRSQLVLRTAWRTMRTGWSDVSSIRVERGHRRDMLVIVDSRGNELRASFYDPALTPLETVKAQLDGFRALS